MYTEMYVHRNIQLIISVALHCDSGLSKQ